MKKAKQLQGVDEKLSCFLTEQTNLTLAVADGNIPYCANCFYAYDLENNELIFKSKEETKHVSVALCNNQVAGTITPDILDKTRVRGIQFTGTMTRPKNDELLRAQSVYYRKYPFALTIKGELWVLELETLKLTDNKLGFGKNLTWIK